MKHPTLPVLAMICSLSCGTAGSLLGAQQPEGFPNVVLIMTDNHGAWTLGCYGNPDIRTPNIDGLAKEGTLFERSFASNPVCSPTRATFLTGLIPSQHGVHSFLSGGHLQVGPDARCTLDNLTSLPEVLKDAGYACGLVGKWHLGDNLHPQEGLDEYWITMPHGGTSTFYNADVIENSKIRKEPRYLTDLWTEHAVKFIEQQSTGDKPFFLFLAYNGPYSLGRLLLKDGQNRHAAYYADKELASFPRSPPHPWQLNNRDYINNPTSIRRVASEVSGVDDGVGTVMQTLKQQGLDENTIVIFVADQGWVGGHGGFFGMGDHTRPLTARDGMMLIPTIWRHPNKIVAGKRSPHMIANYDLMPTLLNYLGLAEKIPAAPRSPGHDYSPILTQQAASNEDSSAPIFYEFENLRCIRTETLKYVHRHPNGPHELYDLAADPDEFVNLVGDDRWQSTRDDLKKQLDDFYGKFAEPKYDMWKGGTSQVRIHDGIDEEIAQLTAVDPPPLTAGFTVPEISVPQGFSVQLAAGPPLVTHPTMACFDDAGRLYVCNNAGVNMTNQELEEKLPNSIVMLTDQDRDGRFDTSTLFADKMTFPMGGVWHDGALYVASPPNIWRLRDTDDDGVADERTAIVSKFGYNGNAASIHGCFFGPDGRIYWTDGFHGHEFTDESGKVTSSREGSYIFSCRSDGNDVRIHCGGGMDNPVEVDFTDRGDMLGTVNILYTRPRVDCLVHWLHGGAYPHREKVLNELKVTGDFLGPAHRFGHVAVSGLTRYRSGTMDHRWQDNLFATFFNRGKVVRLSLQPSGSTYTATQHEFLASTSREFHPTDVLEDADGSLLVVDTGGWFYRGCPTSQFAKPELLGGIYRVRRDGMTPLVDPRGLRIDWQRLSNANLVRLFNDTRYAVRQQAIKHSVKRAEPMIATLASSLKRSDIRVRRNCLWALCRLAQEESTSVAANAALAPALSDARPEIRQAACRAFATSASPVKAKLIAPLLTDPDPGVRRQAATTLGQIGDIAVVPDLLAELTDQIDRSHQHAIIYALIEIGEVDFLKSQVAADTSSAQTFGALIALDQIDGDHLTAGTVTELLDSPNKAVRGAALKICLKHAEWSDAITSKLASLLDDQNDLESRWDVVEPLLPRYASKASLASRLGRLLDANQSEDVQQAILRALAQGSSLPLHPSWVKPIRKRLRSGRQELIQQALQLVSVLDSDRFDTAVEVIGANPSLPPLIRVAALRTLQGKSNRLTNEMFEMLHAILLDGRQPGEAARAADIIGSSALSDDQLIQLTATFANASPAQLRELVRCYGSVKNADVIDAFVDAVGSAKSLNTLAENELSDVVKRFPKEKLAGVNGLLDRLKQHEQAKLIRLSELKERIFAGDAERGRTVFFSEKAKCSACHRVGDKGQRVGPDLTTIGANRSIHDLLESIVVPSASIVRDYETYSVLTVDGRVINGLIAKETTAELVIQQANGEKVTVAREEIDTVNTNPVSIMPNGLEEALSETDLADVIAYLKSQK